MTNLRWQLSCHAFYVSLVKIVKYLHLSIFASQELPLAREFIIIHLNTFHLLVEIHVNRIVYV